MLKRLSLTNVTQKLPHKRYSKMIHKRYSKIDPQTLLKIDLQTLLKNAKKLTCS